jgi:hypothetical protein
MIARYTNGVLGYFITVAFWSALISNLTDVTSFSEDGRGVKQGRSEGGVQGVPDPLNVTTVGKFDVWIRCRQCFFAQISKCRENI